VSERSRAFGSCPRVARILLFSAAVSSAAISTAIGRPVLRVAVLLPMRFNGRHRHAPLEVGAACSSNLLFRHFSLDPGASATNGRWHGPIRSDWGQSLGCRHWAPRTGYFSCRLTTRCPAQNAGSARADPASPARKWEHDLAGPLSSKPLGSLKISRPMPDLRS
jgi:hypothetical protein